MVTRKIKVVKMYNTIYAFKELIAEETTTQKYQTQQNMLNPGKRSLIRGLWEQRGMGHCI